MRRLPTFALLTLALVSGCRDQPQPPATPGATGTVTIEVEFADRLETIQVDDVAAGTRLEAVMRSVDQIPIEIRGSGLTAFVDRIGEVGTNSSEGWTFKVDGEFANQGIGGVTLDPPTTIRWSFGDGSEFAL